MANELQIFTYKEQQVRTTEIDSEIWFVAKDVCDVLEMTVEATRRLDNDEKGLKKIQTPGGVQDITIIGSVKGLSSKLCMRFFLCHFRETVCVSHIEVT